MRLYFLLPDAMTGQCIASENDVPQTVGTRNKKADKYHLMIKKCDDIADKESRKEENFSTVGMKKVNSDHVDCYVKIINDIITTHYSKNSKEMLKEFNLFLESTWSISYTTRFSDFCYPNECGSGRSIGAGSATIKILRTYFDHLLISYAHIEGEV